MPRTARPALLEKFATSWIVLVGAVLLAVPALGSGFSSDDDILLPALEGKRLDAPPWYDLYHFAGRSLSDVVAQGILPWWSAPHLRLHLVRPLPSMLLALDHALFGRDAYGYHVHSLVWLAVLLLLARSFFLQVLDRRTATLALAVFALSPNFTLAARLVAARHILVTAVAVAVGLLFLARSEAKPRSRLYAAMAFSLALATGEGGLAGLAFWVAYEVLGPGERASRERWRRALLPMILGTAYLVVYALTEGGAREMDIYVDPLGDPVGFAKAVLLRMPMLLANVVWSVDAGAGALWPVPMIMAGLIGAAIVVAIARKTWPAVPTGDAGALRWLVPGAVFATFGVAGGMPGGRELVVASLGFAPLLATLVLHGWRLVAGEAKPSFWLRRTMVAMLAVLHVALAPLATLGTWALVEKSARANEQVGRQMKDAAGQARRVVLLTGSDPSVWIYGLRLARDGHGAFVQNGCWWLASAAKGEHRVELIDANAFSIEAVGTTFLDEEATRMYRAKRLLIEVGHRIDQCGAALRVASTRDGQPYRLDVRLDVRLDDPAVALLAWRNGAIERVSFAEVSNGLSIPWSPGPLGRF